MSHHDEHSQFFWSMLLIAVGVIWVAYNLGLVQSSVTQYWPVIFIIIGVWKLLHEQVLG